MADGKGEFLKTTANKFWVAGLFLIVGISACASMKGGSVSDVLKHVTPLKVEDACGDGQGAYQKIYNSHSSRVIVATVETDMIPDPHNWYPTRRDFTLDSGQTRVLGCSAVSMGGNDPGRRVSYTVVSARFK